MEQGRARLQDIEGKIANIMAAIEAGILTPSTKSALEQAEAERARLKELLERKPRQAERVLTFLPDAIGRFKALIDDLANPTQLQVDKARAALRGLLGKEILLHPTADGMERYLTAEIAGDYGGLLRLETGKNKFGGGQGS